MNEYANAQHAMMRFLKKREDLYKNNKKFKVCRVPVTKVGYNDNDEVIIKPYVHFPLRWHTEKGELKIAVKRKCSLSYKATGSDQKDGKSGKEYHVVIDDFHKVKTPLSKMWAIYDPPSKKMSQQTLFPSTALKKIGSYWTAPMAIEAYTLREFLVMSADESKFKKSHKSESEFMKIWSDQMPEHVAKTMLEKHGYAETILPFFESYEEYCKHKDLEPGKDVYQYDNYLATGSPSKLRKVFIGNACFHSYSYSLPDIRQTYKGYLDIDPRRRKDWKAFELDETKEYLKNLEAKDPETYRRFVSFLNKVSYEHTGK